MDQLSMLRAQEAEDGKGDTEGAVGVRGCPKMAYTRQGNRRELSAFYVNDHKLREGFPLFREQEKAGTDSGTQESRYWAGAVQSPSPFSHSHQLSSRTGSGHAGARAGGQNTGDLCQGHDGTSRCILERFTQTLVPEQVPHPSRSDFPHGFTQAAGTGELWEQKHREPCS